MFKFVIPVVRSGSQRLTSIIDIDFCLVLSETDYCIYNVCNSYCGDDHVNYYSFLRGKNNTVIDDTRWLSNMTNEWLFMFSDTSYRFISEDMIVMFDYMKDKFLFWVDGYVLLREHFPNEPVRNVFPCVSLRGSRCIPSVFSQVPGALIKTKGLKKMAYNEVARYLV